MKTFYSILGGLTTVGTIVGFTFVCFNPTTGPVLLYTVFGLVGVAAVALLFYLGYTFTRDVILG